MIQRSSSRGIVPSFFPRRYAALWYGHVFRIDEDDALRKTLLQDGG